MKPKILWSETGDQLASGESAAESQIDALATACYYEVQLNEVGVGKR